MKKLDGKTLQEQILLIAALPTSKLRFDIQVWRPKSTSWSTVYGELTWDEAQHYWKPTIFNDRQVGSKYRVVKYPTSHPHLRSETGHRATIPARAT